MSHNVSNEYNEETLNNLCKFLLLQENYINGTKATEIIPCTCLSQAFEIAKFSNKICTLFERKGSMGKYWQYLCDISIDVI